MTVQPPQNRPDKLLDLTRWNRACLSRFTYVDGNAATWLEELRIALLGLYTRGCDDLALRTPEYWRNRFMLDPGEWPTAAQLAAIKSQLTWDALYPTVPDKKETSGVRNLRLVAQYGQQPVEYGWEIVRAFARALHVLLGYQDAYANEGYLRTATQWDNVRRLAAMVNYQPRPPASAVATVALIIDPARGPVTIDRGLAMKYAPQTGTPIVYETISPLTAHPELNAVRCKDWDINITAVDFKQSKWLVADNKGLAPGSLCAAVLEKPNGEETAALSIKKSSWSSGVATLIFDETADHWPKNQTSLMVAPDGVLVGLPVTDTNMLVLELPQAANFPTDSIVAVVSSESKKRTEHEGEHRAERGSTWAVVDSGANGYLKLKCPERPTGPVTVERLTPLMPADASASIETSSDIRTLVYRRISGVGDPWVQEQHTGTKDLGNGTVHNLFSTPSNCTLPGYAHVSGDQVFNANVVGNPPEIVPGQGSLPKRTVRFAGKPPKALTAGAWFVARAAGKLAALKVEGIRKEDSVYYLQFDKEIDSAPDETEFHGPMAAVLRPDGYNISPVAAIAGNEALLEGLSDGARDFLKPGRAVIVERDGDFNPQAAEASLVSFVPDSNDPSLTKITLDSEADFTGWSRGTTVFRLNSIVISHGETKAPKTLGSGAGEQASQNFPFKVQNLSFIPSNAADAGVVPDMDVTVDGTKWDYRDYIDPTADGTASYSIVQNDDGTLQIYFRRRLPTGGGNVVVTRYRVGSGGSGNAAPPYGITKPMKKNRNVTAVIQPFALAGGAEREPVSAMRVNAPARLAANGRCVSLKDFERLCLRRAGVWRARAAIVPGTANLVSIVVVPAGGSALTARLSADLQSFLATRMLPGTRLVLNSYVPLKLTIGATIRVDSAHYEKNDVKRNCAAALAAAFALQRRDLGEAVYIASALAALQEVPGVLSAVISSLAVKGGSPAPEREASISGGTVAIFPASDQTAFVAGPEDITLVMENAS